MIIQIKKINNKTKILSKIINNHKKILILLDNLKKYCQEDNYLIWFLQTSKFLIEIRDSKCLIKL